MSHPPIPGSWVEAPAQHAGSSPIEGVAPSIRSCSSAGAQYLREINRRLGGPEDLGSIDSYIGVLDKELDILRLQEKNKSDKLAHVKDRMKKNAEKVELYSEIAGNCARNMREPFLSESREEKTFFEALYTGLRHLKSLQASKTYLLILAQVERLSCSIEKCIETNQKTALISYHQLIQWNYSVNKSNKDSERPLAHLEMFVQERLRNSWDIIEIKLCQDFHNHFEEIGWPDRIRKGISPSAESFKRFQSSFQTLLIQHREIIKSLKNKDENLECTQTGNSDVLLPFLIMVRPLNIQFRYHFMEKRKTDRIDKSI